MTTITFQVSIPVDALAPMLRAIQLSGASYRMPDAAHQPVGEFAEMKPLAAARVVLKQDGPSSTRELNDKLLAGGMKTESKNFINSLGVTLSNAAKSKKSDIVKDSDEKWRLKTPEEMQAP